MGDGVWTLQRLEQQRHSGQSVASPEARARRQRRLRSRAVVSRRHGGSSGALCRRRRKKGDRREPQDHALGRSRGGFSTKIHLLCDGQGHALHFELTAGQAHETTAFLDTLDHADVRHCQSAVRVRPAALAGDKAYQARWILDALERRGIEAVIPAKGEAANDDHHPDFDRELYARRNIVERLVGWLKECRRVLTRFEKTAINFAGMITVAIIQRYLRHICPEQFSNRA